MNFQGYTKDEVARWAWLRAVEWGSFPAYLSQLAAPILFIFYPWYCVLLGVVVLGVAWLPVRYTFVSVPLANAACLAVMWFKWPAAIGSSVFLFRHQQPVAGVVALLWPLLAGLAGKPAQIGLLQEVFLSKMGFRLPSEDMETDSAKAAPRQIVIVDDDEEMCELYSSLLREWFPGVSIQCFQDGLKGWEHLAQHDPDLVIMDLNRTGVDGIETLRRLTALEKTYPIFIASGTLESREMQVRVRSAAGPLRLSLNPKPLTVEQFRGEVFRLLGLDPFKT